MTQPEETNGSKHVVCRVDELPPGERKIVTIGKRSIGVFNVEGTYRAFRNVCPHHGAEICLGDVTKMMASSEPHVYELSPDLSVLRCPWHGYEFDAETGEAVVADHLRVRVYPVTVEDGQVVIHD